MPIAPSATFAKPSSRTRSRDSYEPLTDQSGADRCTGTTINVAPEGLLVKAPLDVELGETLELELTVPGHAQPVRPRATVVRHGGGLFAVHFPGDPRARAVIAEFVVEQRAAQNLAALAH